MDPVTRSCSGFYTYNKMECCYIEKYLAQQGLKDPQYSEPKWVRNTSGAVDEISVEFPSVAFIYVVTLITPIVDGGASGLNCLFVINDITLFGWSTGVGLQSDVKVIPANYLIPGTTAQIGVRSAAGDGTALGLWSVQLITISAKDKC